MKNYSLDAGKGKKTMEGLLEASRLPSLEEITAMASGEIDGLPSTVYLGPAVNRLLTELKRGRASFAVRGVLGKPSHIDINAAELPYLLFGDSYFDTDFDPKDLMNKLATERTVSECCFVSLFPLSTYRYKYSQFYLL